MNKASWLALVAPWFLVSGGMFAQTDVVIRWVDEQGQSASQNELAGIVLHVSSWLDGVTRDAVQSEVLVVDSAGWCQCGLKSPMGCTIWRRCRGRGLWWWKVGMGVLASIP